MIEFWITDLQSSEEHFSVPCKIGTWEFHRREDYNDLLKKMEECQCAPTYYASNITLDSKTSDDDFDYSLGELIDICLILSFFTAKCVTPRDATRQSDAQFLQLGDSFIPPRAICGFDKLSINRSFNDIFSCDLPSMTSAFLERRMRLFLSHWISGLTCFSIEDIFLSIGVQLDIVKQCEIQASGQSKTYFEGMQSASSIYGLIPLSSDYKNMRNDIVHEGKLSGSNFSNKSKQDCAGVTADALNWIDQYILKVLSITIVPSALRWKAGDIWSRLPALSFHV